MSSADDTARVLVTPDDLLGFSIDGKYRLDAILGGGGMGVVYRTTQQNLNREIAIKLLKLDDASEASRLGRFRREIDIVAQLTHPHIVRVFDSGRDPDLGLHYIAMELVDGVTLDEVMQGHRLAPSLAIDIAHQVCAALTEPHRLGIIHRDIKPANILLTSRSDDTIGVKVVDFGIARGISTEGSGAKITTTGVVVGSPMYMAPEVARGETLDARTDLYSLGVLLYEMLTGDTPFRGSTPVAIMLRHAVDEPPSLGDFVDDDFHFPELVELVDSMLSKDRRQRPGDAKQVLRRLEAIRTAHHIGRVTIDGSKPPERALAPFTLTVDRSDADERQTDPFSPTTPLGEAQAPAPESGSDSFAGWLVPEAARDRLTGKNSRVVLTEDHPGAGGNDRRRAVLGGIVIVALVLGTVATYFVLPGRPDGDATTEPTIDAPPAKEPARVVDPQPAEVQVPATEDAGPDTATDAAAPDAAREPKRDTRPTPVERGTKPSLSDDEPAERPPDDGEAEQGSDEFEEGMRWLDEK